MNIFPLYEFPPDTKVLEKIIFYIEQTQPISVLELKKFVGTLLGKRPSRTNITIKELSKLGIIEGGKGITLSWETQLYLDLKKPLSDLLIYLSYKKIDLFRICKDICRIDPQNTLSKPQLLLHLYELGYEEGKLSTNREKLHGITRFINICKESTENNPFEEYEHYMDYLNILETIYLSHTKNKYNVNVTLAELKENIKEKNCFEYMLNKLYSDPLLSPKTSFSSVSNAFAIKGFVKLNHSNFYYLKIKESLDPRR
ncbi:hypothetical protein [Lysinibacillus sp. NPDC047702]|uniref:hypothetical protein n=1 Tax=unclassified Lysinibacillus TaxID=2636778 RepID=UPI003D07D3B5